MRGLARESSLCGTLPHQVQPFLLPQRCISAQRNFWAPPGLQMLCWRSGKLSPGSGEGGRGGAKGEAHLASFRVSVLWVSGPRACAAGGLMLANCCSRYSVQPRGCLGPERASYSLTPSQLSAKLIFLAVMMFLFSRQQF